MIHEWVEVKNRRWCVCCTAFQQKGRDQDPWPTSRRPCPKNTPYALNRNAICIEPLSDSDGVSRDGADKR